MSDVSRRSMVVNGSWAGREVVDQSMCERLAASSVDHIATVPGKDNQLWRWSSGAVPVGGPSAALPASDAG